MTAIGDLFAFVSACAYTSLVILTKHGNRGKDKCDTIVIQLIILLSSVIVIYLITLLYLLINPTNTLIYELKNLAPLVFLIIMIEGLLGSFSGLYFITKATEIIGPSRASVLRCCNPLFTIILSIIILNETPGVKGFIAIIILMIGIAVVSYKDEEINNYSLSGELLNAEVITRRQELLGNFYALLSGLSFSLSQITRGLAISYGATPLIIILVSFPFSFLVLYIIFYFKAKSLNFFGRLSWDNIKWFSMGGASSVVGNFALSLLFEYIPVWRAVAIRNTQPIVAVVMSWLLLKKEEKITARLVLGAILVVVGALLSLI